MPVTATAAASVLQTGFGIAQSISAKAQAKKLLAKRKAFVTPKEITDILNATESNAQQGYDPTTLSYLTNQTDQAFSSSIDSANRLGADPNILSSIFSQKIDNIMQIGKDNHQQNLANFSAYLNALGTVAENDAAMQKSREDLLKDQLQAAGAKGQAGQQNISSGANALLAALAYGKESSLFTGGKGKAPIIPNIPS